MSDSADYVFHPETPTHIQVANNGRPAFTIQPDGAVVLGEGVTLDEASRAFWEAIASMAPRGWRLLLTESAAELHQRHWQVCNCLADKAICCVPTCPCKSELIDGEVSG